LTLFELFASTYAI